MNKSEILKMIIDETEIMLREKRVKAKPAILITSAFGEREFIGDLLKDVGGLNSIESVISLVREAVNRDAIRVRSKGSTYPDLVSSELKDGEVAVGVQLLVDRDKGPFPKVMVLARRFSLDEDRASLFVHLGFGTELTIPPKKGDEFKNVVSTYIFPTPRRGFLE